MPGGCCPQESVRRAGSCKISKQASNHTHSHLETGEGAGSVPTPPSRPQALERTYFSSLSWVEIRLFEIL